jgi:hypothetical protein
MKNCPFYGRAIYPQVMLPLRFLLIDSQGNQCALVTDAHSPCRMEIDGLPVEWRECPLIKDIRMEGS